MSDNFLLSSTGTQGATDWTHLMYRQRRFSCQPSYAIKIQHTHRLAVQTPSLFTHKPENVTQKSRPPSGGGVSRPSGIDDTAAAFGLVPLLPMILFSRYSSFFPVSLSSAWSHPGREQPCVDMQMSKRWVASRVGKRSGPCRDG